MALTTIKVKQLTGKVFHVTIDLEKTVLELKHNIHKTLTEYPPESQRLILKGKFLKDSEKLNYYTINQNDIVAVMTKRSSIDDNSPPAKKTKTIQDRLGIIAASPVSNDNSEVRRSKRLAKEIPLEMKTSTTSTTSSSSLQSSLDDDDGEDPDYVDEHTPTDQLIELSLGAISDAICNSGAMEVLLRVSNEKAYYKSQVQRKITEMFPTISTVSIIIPIYKIIGYQTLIIY